MRRRNVAIVAIALLVSLAGLVKPAAASVEFTITRLSDTEAVLAVSGTGTQTTTGAGDTLAFINVTSNESFPQTFFNASPNDLSVGSSNVGNNFHGNGGTLFVSFNSFFGELRGHWLI